jgi:rubrerythrin
MSTPNLLDAIRVAKENERIAMTSYADAAQKIRNPLGKKLFEQLSGFEQYHFERLTALVKSLEENGKYAHYEGKEFPQPPVFEIKAAQELEHKSVMAIVTAALELEKLAQNTYADLALRVPDKQGHDMFLRLADEEHKHYRILIKAYWSLNDSGVWTWELT